MTFEELQYTFETANPSDIYLMPSELIVAFGYHMTKRVPPKEWIPKEWATACGIIDQYKRTRDISDKQKYFLINALCRQLPHSLPYL
jgi:hypothetical protein